MHQVYYGRPLFQWFIMALGAATIVLTLRRPDWFWESRKARALRGIIGDQGAAICYGAIGIGLILMAVLGRIG